MKQQKRKPAKRFMASCLTSRLAVLLALLLSLGSSISWASDQQASQLQAPPVVIPSHRHHDHRSIAKRAASAIKTNTVQSAEHLLYQNLVMTETYLKNVRPVRNHLDSIKVKLGMCVMMLEDIVEKDQTMRWHDDFLSWSPNEYNNLSWFSVPSSDIWLPDIALVNSAEPYQLTRKLANIDVTHEGDVGYYPAGRLATKCSLDVTFFPMDFQRCEIRYESWVYPTAALDLEPWPSGAVDIKDLYTNHLWTIVSYYVVREDINYDGNKFATVKFVFEVKRKPLYYFMYFILPLLLLSMLQTLGHTLPVEHPGRMAMLTALFIGSSVTQSSIAQHVPKTSEVVSLIQIYSTVVNGNLIWSMVESFVMLYTLLRLPIDEPSFIAMMTNFFKITWAIPTQATNIVKTMLASPNNGSKDNGHASAIKHARAMLVKLTGSTATGQLAEKPNWVQTEHQQQSLASPQSGCGEYIVVNVNNQHQIVSPARSTNGSVSAAVTTQQEQEKAAADKQEKFKKRWLVYTVALDKSIMYAISAWNLFLPLILFVSIPSIQTLKTLPPGVERHMLNI